MKHLWIDIETRSRCDLKKHGVYRYAADPSTEILIICWAFGRDGPVQTWVKGMAMSPALLSVFGGHQGPLLYAHNASFERNVLGKTFPKLRDPQRWYCTATQARQAALPGGLEDATRMLETKMRKDRRGSELIRLLSVPREDGTFNEDRALMAEFARYCASDVHAMRELSLGLPALTEEARALYVANEIVNDRGLPIDTELCAAATKYAAEAASEAARTIIDLTGGAVKSARGPKLTQWIYDRMPEQYQGMMRVHRTQKRDMAQKGAGAGGEMGHGTRNPVFTGEDVVERVSISLDKDVRANLLDLIETEPDAIDADTAAAIEAAEDAAVSSVAKFQTMLDRVSADGRLRGAFIMNGAVQTGRFSSTGAQLHNFPRLVAEDPAALRAEIVRHRPLPGSVLAALKSMLRPAIRPGKQRGLIVRADWNAVEARGLPWLAGLPAQRYLDAWRDPARDLYLEQANACGLNGHRQGGKVVTLSLGFGGAEGALLRMAKGYGVQVNDPALVVRRWRNANAWAPAFWRALEYAALTALRRRDGVWQMAGIVGIAANDYGLALLLPSARTLYYPFAQFTDSGEIKYAKAGWKPKADAKQWPRAKLWHGTLAENATQAACGDLLRSAIMRCVTDGLPVIGHVHDELIGESTGQRAGAELAREFSRRMLDLPAWAGGLPLAVETDVAACFRK